MQFVIASSLCAQDQSALLSSFFEQRAEEMAEDGLSESQIEDFLESYRQFATTPFNLNSASRSTLESLGILSQFQIESLLEYISIYGSISSFTELELVDGFNRNLVEILRVFSYLGEK
ncbi:MAG: hypothetical protein HUJ90_06715, partial [Bacteroidales bacterium]|nr:hypothetical protein [Bacteroidales bacterium]